MPDLLGLPTGQSPVRSRSRQRARTDAHEHRHSMWDPLKKIGSWLRREEEGHAPSGKLEKSEDDTQTNAAQSRTSAEPLGRPAGLPGRRASRRVIPGLPRPLTFKRMNSEKRGKLLPVPVDSVHRRAASADRRISRLAPIRTLSPPPFNAASLSAPDVLSPHDSAVEEKHEHTIGGGPGSNIPAGCRQVDYSLDEKVDYLALEEPPPPPAARDSFYEKSSQRSLSIIDDVILQEELEARWILNLSMHFRDRSDREKFFITFAEEPTRWRRVTVSCDYREMTPDSLEADLKTLHYQRDKSARIYEAIRDSLPDIQFYDTVTNLKLQTEDGRLHVHVTEDVNEIIPYPCLSAIEHLSCKKFRESSVSFDSHISGFVYKVRVHNKTYIKKEIPGPDAVEEFLYEINALCSLVDSKSVIQFEGVIVDEDNELIKGLLISYADQGALVDVLYDHKHTEQMPWSRREKWARQIIEGLSEIHEAGFVQGDFTLSNIVIDRHDNAKIIDINRRGCPVGWEPPELARLIESGQRISIYIGVKSDLFQLGMALWALAEQQDEPERQERPLCRSFDSPSSVPDYFRDLVRACLTDNPRGRPAAARLLDRFPEETHDEREAVTAAYRHIVARPCPGKEKAYHGPTPNQSSVPAQRHQRSPSSFSNVHFHSTEYLDSGSSYILPSHSRGRSPHNRSQSRNRRSDYSPYPGEPYPGPRSIMSLDDSELENELASLPASRETRWEQVYVDGDTKLVQRGVIDIDASDFEKKEGNVRRSPPAEVVDVREGRKSEETPRSHSMIEEVKLPLVQLTTVTACVGGNAEVPRKPASKASFSERVHCPSSPEEEKRRHTLADLEHEISADLSAGHITTATASGMELSPTDTETPSDFHAPIHQDSGFNEDQPDRISFENERIRQSLEDGRRDLCWVDEEEEMVAGKMWDEKDGTMIAETPIEGEDWRLKLPDMRPRAKSVPDSAPEKVKIVERKGSLSTIQPRDFAPGEEVSNKPLLTTIPSFNLAEHKAVDEKSSLNTIRPPSLTIPTFHHNIPQAVDTSAAHSEYPKL
ncbi:hypothetical protein M011DRAFT_399656 [Sporormia fimetaria CBS 119925]|uniref:Protein kinase domain-containing protein n=1 Tax=Sporormia fimetaria CBS 119925 TaxID=1340428 RepID=A0A6A6VG69_9PLEO|nr:hypothetical protein M011DRAFT_399656 [Sporormia fimetaria CBS 119925]